MTLQVQWMKFLPTPDWVEQSIQIDKSVSTEVYQALIRGWPLILEEVTRALHWAVVEDNPESYLKSEDVKNCKGYCVGRCLFEESSEGVYWVEIECCFLSNRPDGSEFLWKRCIVTLLWNLESRQGQLALSRMTGRVAKLSRLDYKLIGNFVLEDSHCFNNADENEKMLLLKYWSEVRDMLPDLARQAVEDGSFSGELDDISFPNTVNMTGEFYIEDSLIAEREWLTIFLRFHQRRQYASQVNFDY